MLTPQTTDTSDLQDLESLSSLPLPARARWIQRHGQVELERAVGETRESGAVSETGLDEARLAWAVAFNVTGGPSADRVPMAPQPERRRRARLSYRDHWEAKVSWDTVWQHLIGGAPNAPSPSSDRLHASNRLADLAYSVACEQRGDWQPPGFAPVEEHAKGAFVFVYGTRNPMVLARLRRAFPETDVKDIEAATQEAWMRMLDACWAPRAGRRFLGRSRIAKLVTAVGVNILIDARRKVRREVPLEVSGVTDDGERPVIREPVTHETAEETVRRRDEADRVRRCLATLPPRQRVVADMVWLRGVSQVRMAQVLGISAPAVNQRLASARSAIKECLEAGGVTGA